MAKKTTKRAKAVTEVAVDPQREALYNAQAAKWFLETFGSETYDDQTGQTFQEAFTQADIELALDDRGWLVGGKRMAGELDPLSRQVQVNRSRYYWLRDPLAKQAVRLWTDYALGDMAMSWKCDDDQSKEDAITTFMHDRRNRKFTSRTGQRRLSQRLLVDGELFLAIYDDGMIRNFDCLQITDFICNPDDEDEVWGYKRRIFPRSSSSSPENPTVYGSEKIYYYRAWDAPEDAVLYDPGSNRKDIKIEEDVVIYHLPFDNLTQRGNGLLSSCSDWSREHRRFMTARVAIMQALSKFAHKATIKGGQKMVNTLRSKLESTFSQTGLSGGTEHQPPVAPGATWLQNDGINLEQMPRATGAGDGKTDADQLKLMVAAGTGIFLHYFGDPSTGNLATATAMEMPMLKMFMSYQAQWKEAWMEIFSIVLGIEDPDELDDVVLEFPPIVEDDLQKLAQFLTSISTMFPEAKVPSLLRQCLMSANVNNIDDVMKEIEDNKAELDKKAQADQQQQHQNNMDLVKAKQGNGEPGEQSLGAGGLSGNLEANRIARLVAAVEKLAEAMR